MSHKPIHVPSIASEGAQDTKWVKERIEAPPNENSGRKSFRHFAKQQNEVFQPHQQRI
jgi:hypothetical protein